MGIEEEVLVGMKDNWPILEDTDGNDFPARDDGFSKKIAVERLLPTKYLGYVHGASRGGKRVESLASSRTAARCEKFWKMSEILAQRTRRVAPQFLRKFQSWLREVGEPTANTSLTQVRRVASILGLFTWIRDV
eukprot:g23241.t1